MIELVEVHEPKVAPSTEPPKLSFTDEKGILWRLCGEIENKNGGRLGQYVPVFDYECNPMIDTDFEKQKQQGKDMIYPADFKPIFSASPETVALAWERAKKDFEASQKLKEDFTKGGYTGNAKPEKPHWFERFLRW